MVIAPGNRRLIAATAANLACAALALGTVAADEATGTSVTIFRAAGASTAGPTYDSWGNPVPARDRSAVVTDRRRVQLDEGEGKVELRGVPAQIDAATVAFKSLTDPDGTRAVRQRFSDSLSPDAVLRSYIDHDIVIATDRGDVAGRLRSFDDTQLLVETDDADRSLRVIRRADHVRGIKLSARAEPLAVEPTLVWDVAATQGGEHLVEMTYRTGGLEWDTEYTAIYDEASGTVDLSSWVTIDNTSSVDFTGAELVLVSDPSMSPPPQVGALAAEPVSVDTNRWSYTLGEAVALTSGATTHVELFAPLVGAAAERVTVFEPWEGAADGTVTGLNKDCHTYRYDTYGYRHETDMVVELANAAASATTAYPDGPVRVYRSGDSGALELLGENALEIDPETGAMGIRVGTDDNITGQRRQLDCSVDEYRRRMRERVEIQLKNEGDEPTDVILREYMQRGPEWRVDVESIPGRSVGRSRYEYRVTVAPGETTTVSYTVIYRW